jgi:hypothetical protein
MTGLQMLQTVIATLRPYLKKGSIDEAKAKWLKENLDNAIPFFSSPIFEMRFPELQRVTINKNLFEGNNDRINDTSFVKFPPEDKVKKNGRANYIGQSVLYATFNPITAMKEMKPQKGDLVTVSIWKQKENDEFLKICPIFKITSLNGVVHNELSLKFKKAYENSLKGHDKETAEQIDELLMFVADCFAKDVDYGNNYDYILSAFYANKILNEFQGGTIDTLVYPSVADKLDFSNLAIKPYVFNNHYDLFQVDEGVVVSTPNENGGGHIIEGTGWSRTFDNGKIMWK